MKTKVSNPGDSLDGIVRGFSTVHNLPGPLDQWVRRELWESAIAEAKILKEAVESWEGTFERFGLEPDTAIHAVNDIEREYERIRSSAEKMAEAWELDSSSNDIAEAMDEAVNEYRSLIPANVPSDLSLLAFGMPPAREADQQEACRKSRRDRD